MNPVVIFIWNVIIIVGGGAVFRSTDGPSAVAFAALTAYVSAVAVAMYAIHLRGRLRR